MFTWLKVSAIYILVGASFGVGYFGTWFLKNWADDVRIERRQIKKSKARTFA